jgi:hypothetical protein
MALPVLNTPRVIQKYLDTAGSGGKQTIVALLLSAVLGAVVRIHTPEQSERSGRYMRAKTGSISTSPARRPQTALSPL